MAVFNVIGSFSNFQEIDNFSAQHLEIENAHYASFPEFFQENPTFSIVPNNTHQNVIIRAIESGKVVETFQYTAAEFEDIQIDLYAESGELDIKVQKVEPEIKTFDAKLEPEIFDIELDVEAEVPDLEAIEEVASVEEEVIAEVIAVAESEELEIEELEVETYDFESDSELITE